MLLRTRPASRPAAATPRARAARVGFFLALLALLLVRPGATPVTRTQEARVLETARQMRESSAPHPYLLPELDGQLRLQKPPLAYWLAAASFHVLGPSAAAGRFPTILAGWGTLLLTYLAGRTFFNRRTGLLAAAALASSFLFYRHTRLAETDAPATLFVTAATLCFWKAAATPPSQMQASPAPDSSSPGPLAPARHPFLLYHLGAAAAVGAALSKGPPAAFPLLFLLLYFATHRPFRGITRFLRSGAPLTLLVGAIAWYAYLASRGLLAEVFFEVDTLAAGRNHGNTFLVYVPYLLLATLPWSPFVVAAAVDAARRFRTDPATPAALCWVAAILVPLCLIGNKQPHYLLPALPPLMLLTGATLDRLLSMLAAPDPARTLRPFDRAALGWILFGTAAAAAAGAIAIPIVSWQMARELGTSDAAMSAALLAASAALLFLHHRGGLARSIPAFATAAVLLVPLTLALWAPHVIPDDYTPFARALEHRFGAGARYALYQQTARLPLNFDLQKTSPVLTTEDQLRQTLAAHPDTVFLASTYHATPAPPPPPGLTPTLTLPGRQYDLHAFTRPASPPTSRPG